MEEKPDYQNLTITDEEFEALTRAILLRYGIDFTHYEQVSLKRRMLRVLYKFNFENTYELWRKLLQQYSFIYEVIDEITVGLTELFRNPEMWIKIKTELLPTLKDKERIKIWHAGCSTGEEVYSMLIVLHESGLLHKTDVLATDINGNFLQQAAQGIFHTETRRQYRLNYAGFNPFKTLSDYATDTEDGFQMKDFLKTNVRFLPHNLIKDNMNEHFDIIFCRNVMIYFDDTFKNKALTLFHQSMNTNGFFIMGFYDSFPQNYTPMFMIYDGKNKIYRKI